MNSQALISVVVPVKNGEATIRECLDAVIRQTIFSSIEIIIIDSGSTDATLEILKAYPVKLITIEPGDFNHGLTRNIGATAASGKFIYFTVQDARLASDDALEKMVQHFKDEQVAGVCGEQGVPHDKDKNPASWYKPISTPTINRYYFKYPADFEKLTPSEKIACCAWDNVNAMYRKEILIKFPFNKTDFGEDMIWAENALLNGCSLIKDSGIITWHYHHRSFGYEYKVSLTVLYQYYKEFSYVPTYPPVVKKILQILKKLIKERSIGFLNKFYWLGHNLLMILANCKAIYFTRRAIKKGGAEELGLLYETNCIHIPLGRLKGQ